MRKLEYLRKVAEKITTEDQIYFLELPKEFNKKGCYEDAYCIPMVNKKGKLAGICIVNNFLIHGETVQEDYFVTSNEFFKVPFPNIK